MAVGGPSKGATAVAGLGENGGGTGAGAVGVLGRLGGQGARAVALGG